MHSTLFAEIRDIPTTCWSLSLPRPPVIPWSPQTSGKKVTQQNTIKYHWVFYTNETNKLIQRAFSSILDGFILNPILLWRCLFGQLDIYLLTPDVISDTIFFFHLQDFSPRPLDSAAAAQLPTTVSFWETSSWTQRNELETFLLLGCVAI